jgi:hypothetical protein
MRNSTEHGQKVDHKVTQGKLLAADASIPHAAAVDRACSSSTHSSMHNSTGNQGQQQDSAASQLLRLHSANHKALSKTSPTQRLLLVFWRCS